MSSHDEEKNSNGLIRKIGDDQEQSCDKNHTESSEVANKKSLQYTVSDSDIISHERESTGMLKQEIEISSEIEGMLDAYKVDTNVSYSHEVWLQCQIAIPVCCTFLMRKSVDIVSVIYVGHLGSHYLSAAGIAAVTANVTGNSVVIGLTGALSTIASQAYGSKDFVALSLAPQRAILIITIAVCIPVTILWMYSARVMVTLGLDSQIAENSSKYLIVLIPSLWAYALSQTIQNWLHAQSKTTGIAIVTILVAILHPIWCYVYIYIFELGYLGAAFAVTTSKLSELLLIFGYINCFGISKDTNFQFDLDCFTDWGPFLKLGLPNILMMSEWWASEVIIFMAGSLTNPELSVSSMTLYQNTLSICFMIPVSFHVAVNTRVGNSLGAGKAHTAKLAATVSPILAFLCCCCSALALYQARFIWPRLFTNDETVVKTVSTMMPVLCVYIVGDGVQSAFTGVLKGLGKQLLTAPIVLFSYYVVGIPISYYLAFRAKPGGVLGLCIGNMTATITHMILVGLFVLRTNWCKEAKKVLIQKHKELWKRSHPTVDVTQLTFEIESVSDDEIETCYGIVEIKLFQIYEYFYHICYSRRRNVRVISMHRRGFKMLPNGDISARSSLDEYDDDETVIEFNRSNDLGVNSESKSVDINDDHNDSHTVSGDRSMKKKNIQNTNSNEVSTGLLTRIGESTSLHTGISCGCMLYIGD